jgi:hypothetical protein
MYAHMYIFTIKWLGNNVWNRNNHFTVYSNSSEVEGVELDRSGQYWLLLYYLSVSPLIFIYPNLAKLRKTFEWVVCFTVNKLHQQYRYT